MRKTILTISRFGVACGVDSPDRRGRPASQRPKGRPRAGAGNRAIRNSNAYAWPSPSAQPNWSRYEGGAISAPAGR